MSAKKIFTLTIEALQQCHPEFQVVSLIILFLSVLSSFVYIVLYAPLERLVVFLVLAFAFWQSQQVSSLSNSSFPKLPSRPPSALSTSTSEQETLPVYTPKASAPILSVVSIKSVSASPFVSPISYTEPVSASQSVSTLSVSLVAEAPVKFLAQSPSVSVVPSSNGIGPNI